MAYRGRVGLTVDIFEGTDATPVLTHTAWGHTRAEAQRILEVHAQYDSFLRAALDGRPFKGIPLNITVRVTAV